MSKRILVVEDQEDNCQIIRDMLSATDYEITEAENGEEALAGQTTARSHTDGYSVTHHGRLRGDAPYQGRSSAEIDSDHCRHFLCTERRTREGASSGLR